MLVSHGCHQFGLVYGHLGIPQEGICLENARLHGSEVQLFAQRLGYHLSLGYCQVVLRAFREDVLSEFFQRYPEAARLENWKDVADAVSVFTYQRTTDKCWFPERRAVVDAIQKFSLLRNKIGGEATWIRHRNEIRIYSAGRLRRRCVVKCGNSVWEPEANNISTILRIENRYGTRMVPYHECQNKAA